MNRIQTPPTRRTTLPLGLGRLLIGAWAASLLLAGAAAARSIGAGNYKSSKSAPAPKPAEKADGETEGIPFTFRPLTPSESRSTVTRTTLQRLEGVGEQSEILRGVITERFKKSRKGYLLEQIANEIVIEVNGQRVDSPMTHVLNGAKYEISIDEEGRAVSVEGFDKLRDRMLDVLPEEAKEMIDQLFDIEMMEKRALLDWERTLGGFAGQSLAVGQPFNFETETIPPSNRTLPYYVSVKVEGLEEKDGGRFARILLSANSSGFSLNGRIERLTASIDQETPKVDSMLKKAEAIGYGVIEMDPKTMFVRYAKQVEAVRMKVPGPDGEPLEATIITITEGTSEEPKSL